MSSGASRDFAACAREWTRLARAGQLTSPHDRLGMPLRFADGGRSFVFRETARVDPPPAEPALLVISFRLAALGSVPVLHAAFRRECVLHTPLFAGFPGFRSKLWVDDVESGVYRGIYEWGGAEAAEAYARRMVALLAPFSSAGTARHHVVAGVPRDRYLIAPETVPGAGTDDAWWRLAAPPVLAHV